MAQAEPGTAARAMSTRCADLINCNPGCQSLTTRDTAEHSAAQHGDAQDAPSGLF